MNINIFLMILFPLFFGISIFGTASAQIFSINDIEFIQTGKLFTEEREFDVSNQITIREFFDGKIIRITGYTVDGYPYITYSKIHNEQIITRGKIFTDNIGTTLFFDQQKTTQSKKMKSEKNQMTY